MKKSVFDFHSHVLPKMDDGSENLAMSCEMLSQLASQGVECVFCTPHYLSMHESVADFIARREQSYKALTSHIEKQGFELPKVMLGAEIRVCRGISESELSGLEYEDTSALLLELPREELSRQVVKEIYNLCTRKRNIPIIAHIDRYEWFGKKDIEALTQIHDVVFQFNVEALQRRSVRKTMLKLAKDGHMILFGSDCHNMSERKPLFYLLTGKGGKSSLSSKEQNLLLEAHMRTESFIFEGREQTTQGLFF